MKSNTRSHGLDMMVEPFDAARYCGNASVADNLCIRVAQNPVFSDGPVSQSPHLHAVLQQVDIHERHIEIGRSFGTTLVEIFADISPENPLIEQFSFT